MLLVDEYAPHPISIHALLAESDSQYCPKIMLIRLISIHALLAESDDEQATTFVINEISIHALLAESDCNGQSISRKS